MEFIMRKLTLAVAAATLSVPASFAVTAEPAAARTIVSSNVDGSYEYQRRYYDRQGNYVGPTWRDQRGRYRCRRPDGTTGLIIGGAAGALIGREVAGRGDRTLGTILGGAAGALIGREVERGRASRRCR
jgi:hypothetical protein